MHVSLKGQGLIGEYGTEGDMERVEMKWNEMKWPSLGIFNIGFRGFKLMFVLNED